MKVSRVLLFLWLVPSHLKCLLYTWNRWVGEVADSVLVRTACKKTTDICDSWIQIGPPQSRVIFKYWIEWAQFEFVTHKSRLNWGGWMLYFSPQQSDWACPIVFQQLGFSRLNRFFLHNFGLFLINTQLFSPLPIDLAESCFSFQNSDWTGSIKWAEEGKNLAEQKCARSWFHSPRGRYFAPFHTAPPPPPHQNRAGRLKAPFTTKIILIFRRKLRFDL